MSETETVFYYTAEELSPRSMLVLKAAKDYVYGDTPVEFVPVPSPADEVLCFDLLAEHGIRTLENWQMETYPNAQAYVAVALKRYKDGDLPPLPDGWRIIDIESGSIDDRWNTPLDQYFRLGQFSRLGSDEVAMTTDRMALMNAMNGWGTEVNVAHNGHDFDFSVLYGDVALERTLNHGLFDTMIHAITNFYAPPVHLAPSGRRMKSTTPAEARRFYSLATLCFTFGIEGKHGDLKEMAKRLGCGIGEIPLDNEEFLDYARHDIVALSMLTRAMLYVAEANEVAWREQEIAACNAQISRNGWRINTEAAEVRRDALQARKDVLLSRLVRDYNFPTEGVKPWMSNIGKEAILTLLEDHGISRDELPLTKGGAPSLGSEGILEVTDGTDVEALGIALAELMGMRSLPQLALECVQNDGRVHPEITPLQRSGRFSITKPGLTVWGSKEGKDDDKAYFLPDSDDHVIVEADYNAADARIVAALSEDEGFAKQFEPGVDGHNLTGEAVFGEEYYDRLLSNGKPVLRELSKPITHGTSYRIGRVKLANTLNKACKKVGLDRHFTPDEAGAIIVKFDKKFWGVRIWKDKAVAEGESGWITNDWGREMPVTPGKEYTQSPALLGQGGTRDILCDGLIRMAKRGLLQYVKAHIHDAVVFSLPREKERELVLQLVECMETVYRGMPFPVSTGPGAPNWKEAAHG